MKDVTGISFSVIGAERSGVAVAQLLQAKGASVFVSDAGSGGTVTEHCAALRARGIACESGGHTGRVFESSMLVISPGVPDTAPVVTEARKRGIPVVAELEAASWFCRGPIIAITGSNGKTTTTTLLGRMLGDAKKKHVVAGNIGTAFSSVVLDADQETIVVLEVSSFQLDGIETFHPTVAVILNITQNHMDRYDNSMERYASSKARIFMNQTKHDTLIMNADDPWTQRKAATAPGRVLSFSTSRRVEEGAFVDGGAMVTRIGNSDSSIIRTSELSIPGEHNLQNAMAAALAAQVHGVTPAFLRSTLRNFKGVEHRQEFVREIGGISYVNDSKATTVDALAVALKSYDRPIVLIMGGKDKGNDYTAVADLVRTKVKTIIATGHSAGIIERFFAPTVPVETVPTLGTDIPNLASMRKAVQAATSRASQGDVVLLSPACTSFDWFTDYEERGRVFKTIVNGLE